MVAVAILAVIIVGLLAMFYQTQRAFRTGMAQVDVLEGGRAAMELITRDLQEATASLEVTATNFFLDLASGYMTLPLALPANETTNIFVEDVAFLRRENDQWTGESLRVDNAAAGVGTLYRIQFSTNRSQITAVSKLMLTATPADAPFQRVVDGVVHFRILPFDNRGFAIVGPGPGRFAIRRKGIQGWDSFHTYWFVDNGLPAVVDVELGILEPKSVEQFRARVIPGTPPDYSKAQAYLQRHAGSIHFFKQRVALRNGSQYYSVTNVP